MTPYSWKIVTTANTSFNMPFEAPPVAIWNDTIGAPKTATVEGIWNNVDQLPPLDDEVMLELEYLGDAASPLASFAFDGKSNLLTPAALQAASSAPWTGTAVFASYDGATNLVVLSNGNRTVTHNVTTTNAGAISTAFASTGKYYFEVKQEVSVTSSNYVGIMSSLWNGIFSGTSMTTWSTSVIVSTAGTSNIITNGAATGVNFGSTAVGDVYGFAVDLTARRAWLRLNGGNWNADAGANPETGVGGVIIGAGNFAPLVRFVGFAAATDAMTGNFGQVAYAFTMPAGFANWSTGWQRFKLSVPFTAAQKGWVYARVKCAKPSATFYIDPALVLT